MILTWLIFANTGVFLTVSVLRNRARVKTAAIGSLYLNGVLCVFYFVATEIIQLLNLRKFTVLTIFTLLFLGSFSVEICLRIRRRCKNEDKKENASRSSIIDTKSMEFYGEDFLREEKLYKQSLLSEAKEFGQIVSRDNDLAHISISDRCRLTCGTPEKFLNRVFLLGGSTIFNAQVPNSKTIASFLQTQLNSVNAKLKVMNLGISGASSINRLDSVKASENFDAGDIILLYFGVNDTFLPTQFREKINSLDLVFVNLNKVIDILRRNFEIFGQLSFLTKPMAKVRVSKYITNLVIPRIFEFNKVCAQSNLKFLAILQPSLFSNINTDTATVEELNHLPKFVPNFLEMANNLFVMSFRNHGFFVDARHIFKDAIEPVYCDWVHTTEFGNLIISEGIFKEISNRNWIKPLES